MRRMLTAALVSCGLLTIATPGQVQPADEVKLDVVKYEALKEAVLRQRGKVVLVDFWGEF
ncbi:MAG: hypothetical protein NZO58_05695 [Gemmataceae bacterium]|nr:hypothetical protein [Gemmataceae bacterium]